MQTTPETLALFAELYERAAIIAELDGPQIEAWVSGLFPALDDHDTMLGFLDHCAAQQSPVGQLLCAAIAELTAALDDLVSQRASEHRDAGPLPATAAQIGASKLTGAWLVEAPFGRSIVLGFDNSARTATAADDEAEDGASGDLRHSILVEVGAEGELEDLQLAGPAKALLDEAAASDDRVVVADLGIVDALAEVVRGWPEARVRADEIGPGVAANQQFVRRRMYMETQHALAAVELVETDIDVRRGLSDAEFVQANTAARSTLRAAVGALPAAKANATLERQHQAWVGVVRGDGGDVSTRERQALLWLEWADWLGVGIGLLRAGAGAAVSGRVFVDLVNGCPEVSSTVDKGDREYAEWAFDVAIDVLCDAGVVDEGVLTEAGFVALHGALVAAWSGPSHDNQ